VIASAVVDDQVASRVGDWLVWGRSGAFGLAVAVLAVSRSGLRLISRRWRQRLTASVSRIWRWEFWPMWVFYVPVGIWTLLLAIRNGGFRTLTAANPGIADGGIVGESKFDILQRLPRAWTIPSALIEDAAADQCADRLRQVMDQQGWHFPLVLKPDVGQRGTGVRLVATMEEAREYLRRMAGSVLVQPYHPGPFEAGIFYYRLPEWPTGRILAITDKHFPVVIGDGRSSIEDLVWAHDRYRMQAGTFIARLGARRHEVPAPGVRVGLGIAGNHAQGTMFTDGFWMCTPELDARVDAIAREYPGFFIGRFDVRYRDREAFMAGRDLAIVELNGATAECTNIYDPSGSLFAAYRTLFRQWHLVFAIGAANRRNGRAASSTDRLLALVRAHFRSSTPFPVSD
jgi:hypothetical protein